LVFSRLHCPIDRFNNVRFPALIGSVVFVPMCICVCVCSRGACPELGDFFCPHTFLIHFLGGHKKRALNQYILAGSTQKTTTNGWVGVCRWKKKTIKESSNIIKTNRRRLQKFTSITIILLNFTINGKLFDIFTGWWVVLKGLY